MPQIYVVNLESYNAGQTVGSWIDACQPADDIWAEIAEMAGSGDWAIHDSDGFERYPIGENEDLETISALAAEIEEHGEVFAAYAAHVGDVYRAAREFEDAYEGTYDNPENFAYEWCFGVYGKPPEWLEYYVDYESMGEDMLRDAFFDVELNDGRIAVFRRL